MPSPDPLPAYLRRISRRLAIAAGLRRAATGTIVAMVALAAVTFGGLLFNWLGHPIRVMNLLPLAFFTVAIAVGGTFTHALVRRPQPFAAAGHVDRRFHLHELLESAARLPAHLPACQSSPFDQLISSRAASAITRIPPSVAVPLHWTPRLSAAVASMFALITLTLSLPHPAPSAQFTAAVVTSLDAPSPRASAAVNALRPPSSPTTTDSGTQPLAEVLPALTRPTNTRRNPISGGTASATATPGQGAATSPLTPTQMHTPESPAPPWHGLPAREQTHATTPPTSGRSPTLASPHTPSSNNRPPWHGLPAHDQLPAATPQNPGDLPTGTPTVIPADPLHRSPIAQPAINAQHPDIPEHSRELVRRYFTRD